MKSINQQLKEVAQSLGKSLDSSDNSHQELLSYKERRALYAQQANKEVRELQRKSKQARIEQLMGASELNPNWTFDTLIEDSQDAKEAIDIARAFIAAHSDPEWRNSKAHLMLFFGDYGRGKSHIAGAIAHQLIEQYEVTVLYRQLQSLLEMRFFSYDFSADDDAPEQFREVSRQLLDVELLILDEVCVNETILKPNAQSWLGNLLRQRALQKKNCIIITNHSTAELAKALGRYCFESIKEFENYPVHFQGPSRRAGYSDPVLHGQYEPNKL